MVRILIIGLEGESLAKIKNAIAGQFPEHEFSTAGMVSNGLELAGSFQPDVILLASEPKNSDVAEVCSRLKHHPSTSYIPVLMITAPGESPQTRARALEAGIDGFVSQTCDAIDLKAAIQTMLKVRKAAELDLVQKQNRDNKALLHQIYEEMTDVIWACDLNLNNFYISPSVEKMVGFRVDEYLRRTPKQRYPEDDLNYIYRVLQEELEKEDLPGADKDRNRVLQLREYRADGTLAHISVNVKFLRDSGGKINGIVGVSRDITEQKETEAKLRESQRQLSTLLENLPGMAYRCAFDHDWTMQYISPACIQLTGYYPEDFYGNKTLSFNDVILEEFREPVFRAVEDAVKQKEPYILEYKIKTRNGTEKWVWEQGRAVYSDKGEVIALEGYITDFTERKLSELETIASEKILRALFEDLPAACFAFDRDGIIYYWNHACEKLYGWPAGEAIGKSMFDLLVQEKNAKKTRKNIAQIFKGKSFLSLEFEDNTAGGSKVTVLANEYPVYDSAGNVIFGICAEIDITERKKAQEELKKAARNWDTSFNAINDGMLLLDANQRIVQYNKKALELIGATGEIKGEHCYFHVHHTHCSIEGCPFVKMKHSNKREIFELAMNGKILEIIVDPIFDNLNKLTGAVHLMKDITELKKAESEIQKEKMLLRTLIDNLPSTIYVKDTEGRKIIANKADVEILGFDSEQEALGKTDREVFPGQTGQRGFDDDMLVLKKGKAIIDRIEDFETRSGEKRWLSTSKIPLKDENGKIIGLVGIGHDITSQKILMEELQEAKEKAEQSDRLKTAFLANMSHEIRTPMNGILGFLELLKTPGLDESERMNFINIINASAERLLNTINDIIELSRIEAGDVPVLTDNIDLRSFLNFFYEFFLPQATRKGLFLKQPAIDPKLKAIVSDQNKLNSILTNLIKNALKFTQTGSIEFGCKPVNGHVQFYVKDTGKGIKKENISLIFERFAQEDSGLSRGYEGSGLGLAICKAYVEKLGGKIRVESEPGKGSTFFFQIPYQPVTEIKMIRAANPPEPVALPQTDKRLNILIAEDDNAGFLYLSTVLQGMNCKISRCNSGVEAVQIARENPGLDLILMDIKMPEMDGYEATRKIREFNKDVIIIAQTAYALAGDRQKAIDAGCNEYIAKPIGKNKLLEVIGKLIKQ